MNNSFNDLDNSLMKMNGENKFPLPCALSNNVNIKKFMYLTFIFYTKIFYEALNIFFTTYQWSEYITLTEEQKRRFIASSLLELFKSEEEDNERTPPEGSSDADKGQRTITYLNKPGCAFTLTGFNSPYNVSNINRQDYIFGNIMRYIHPLTDTEKEIPIYSILTTLVGQNGPSLSSIMGNIYGCLANPSILLIIYTAYVYNDDFKTRIVNNSMHKLIINFRKLYGAPDTLTEKEFIRFMTKLIPNFPITTNETRVSQVPGVEDTVTETFIKFVKRYDRETDQYLSSQNINTTALNILFATYAENAKGIAGRQFVNQSYLRTRRPKPYNVEYDAATMDIYANSQVLPVCPEFLWTAKGMRDYKTSLNTRREIDTYRMTQSTMWFLIKKNSLQAKLFEKYGRTYEENIIGGYSGSTFMWINFFKNLLGFELDDSIKKQLLLAIVSDFVPIYHSLPEILVVWCQEMEIEEGRYTLDLSPSLWLAKYVNNSDTNFDEYNDKEIYNNNDYLTTIYTSNLPDLITFQDDVERRCKILITNITSEDADKRMSPINDQNANPNVKQTITHPPSTEGVQQEVVIGGKKKRKSRKKRSKGKRSSRKKISKK